MKKIVFWVLLFVSQIAFSQQNLKSDIENIIKDKKAKVGVSVWHLENGDAMSINGDEHLPMMSVFKLHIGLAVLNLVDQGKMDLNQIIIFKKYELIQNTWSPMREKFPNGGELPLSQLLKFMIAESDNNTCDILLKKIGGPKALQDYILGLGIKDFQTVANEQMMHQFSNLVYKNYTTSNSSNFILKKIFTQSILKKETNDFLIKILEETTTGSKRLKGLLPKNVTVAHRTGTSFTEKNGKTAATNDIGVITLSNGQHIVVSVFISDSYEDKKTNDYTIAEIAKVSFEYYNKN